MALKFHKLFSHCPSSNVTAALLVCHYHDILRPQPGHGTELCLSWEDGLKPKEMKTTTVSKYNPRYQKLGRHI